MSTSPASRGEAVGYGGKTAWDTYDIGRFWQDNDQTIIALTHVYGVVAAALVVETLALILLLAGNIA